MASRPPSSDSSPATSSLSRITRPDLLTGMALLITGGAEVLETMVEGFEALMGAHHGLAFLGVVALLRGTAESIEGMPSCRRVRTRPAEAPTTGDRSGAT